MAQTSLLDDKPIGRIGFGAMQLAGPGVMGPPRDPDAARRDDQGAWLPALSPAELRAGVEENLRSLRIERLDLVNLRLLDERGRPDVPLPEQLGARAHLRHEGKLDLIGVSNVSADSVLRALELVDVAAVQNAYSIIDREHEPIVDLARTLRMLLIRGTISVAHPRRTWPPATSPSTPTTSRPWTASGNSGTRSPAPSTSLVAHPAISRPCGGVLPVVWNSLSTGSARMGVDDGFGRRWQAVRARRRGAPRAGADRARLEF